MVFTKTDWRVLRVAIIAAIPLELMSMRILTTTPLDVEPPVKAGAVRLWAGMATVALHFPAFPILQTRLTNFATLIRVIFFTTGYVDILLLCLAILLVHRLLRKLVATRRPTSTSG